LGSDTGLRAAGGHRAAAAVDGRRAVQRHYAPARLSARDNDRRRPCGRTALGGIYFGCCRMKSRVIVASVAFFVHCALAHAQAPSPQDPALQTPSAAPPAPAAQAPAPDAQGPTRAAQPPAAPPPAQPAAQTAAPTPAPAAQGPAQVPPTPAAQGPAPAAQVPPPAPAAQAPAPAPQTPPADDQQAPLPGTGGLALSPQATGPSESDFTVGDIKVEGLQRISEGTVYNYLPINFGDH